MAFNSNTEFVKHEGFHRYITLNVALKYTVEGLEDIVKRYVTDLYEKISRKCHGVGPCVNNCTKTHGSNYQNWCNSCRKWKEEISRFMNKKRHLNGVQWKKFDSKDWSRNLESSINQVANVFVHKCKDPNNSITNDICEIVSLLQNCSYFGFTDKNRNKLLNNVRKVRNKYFAHNSSCIVEKNDLNYSLKNLSLLLKQFQKDNKCQKMHKRVLELKKSIIKIKVEEVMEKISILQPLERLNRNEPNCRISNFSQPNENNRRVITNGVDILESNVPTRHKRWRCDYIIVWLILCYFGFQWEDFIEINFRPKEECKTMDFVFPWESELNFKSYIGAHKDFVGREWMTEDIAYELLHTDHRGLLVAAELGFGKSALISHIACSHDKISSAYPIYEKTVGIHMCRYDSNLTLNPGIFVRNMAGKLAESFPEFGNFLNTENMASKYLTSSKCIQDPNGCFDHTILYPLQKSMSNHNIAIIIIIDALDECIEIGSRNIFSLLNQKIHLLPENIKFLFTSRNISAIRANLPPGISVYQTNLFREKSLGDIKKYISQRLKNNSVIKQYQTLLSSSNLDETLEKLADLVDGNFLFLTHAFDFWVKIGNVNRFPDEMDHIYRLNVLRVFDKTENILEDVRSIIEILCASHGSIKESLLYEILNVDNFERRKYFSRLLSNELSHFIQRSSGKVVFNNKQIADFFSRQNNIENDFYIFQQNGHGLIAKFWLNHLENQHANISVTVLKDIFRHVVFSEDKSLKDRLMNLNYSCINENRYSLLMHYIAASLNSYDATLLAIGLMSYCDIDMKDPGGFTASFIAAAYGNENALAALIEHGANVNYQRPPPVFLQLKLVQDPIHFCKYEAFCGYNLANIAAQNGHANVLKLLIKYKINLCHENSLGLNSFHLASEHAHVHIIQILMSSKLCNWTSSFDQALYHSARNGHVSVIKYLLNINAVDKCVPCSNFIHWIPKGKTRLQNDLPFPNLPYERDYKNYVLRDDKRLYFCESALDIAVQNNHLEVVKILVSQNENALKCVNARGMTPPITAVVFESQDVIYYFLQAGLPLNDSCMVRHSMKKRFSNYDGNRFDYQFCKNELSFWHMLAIHSSSEIVTYLSNSTKYDYVWKLTDKNGATPFHHACCNFRLKMKPFLLLASHMLDRTLDGLTPAHFAVQCLNIVPIYISIKLKKLPVNITDQNKKNILHYFAMQTVGDERISNLFLSEIVNKSYDRLISEQDSVGRTPLHYAAKSGNNLLITNNYWNITFQPHYYMIQDKFNMSALDILFKYMPFHLPKFKEFMVVLPYGCNFDDLFRTPGCPDTRSNILDAFEMFALRAFTDLRKTNLIHRSNIFVYMYEALKKNRFYLIHMMKVIFPKFYQSNCKRKVHFFLAQLMKKSLYPNILLSSTFLPDLLKYACESKKQYGYLWYMFHDSQRKFWQSYLIWNSTHVQDSIKTVLTKCTQTGLVTAALKGGNILLLNLARIDLRKYDDFDLPTSFYQAPNIIPLSKYLTPKIYHKINTEYTWIMNLEPYSHPAVIKTLVSRTYGTLSYNVQCCQHAAELGYYHVISAKGLSSVYDKETHENMKKCKNKYSVTPNQLAYFFNHSLLYQEDIDITKFYQRHFAALFFKITMDFHTFVFPKRSKAWTCFHYVHKINRKSLKKLACLSNLENEICSLISNLYPISWRVFYKIYTFDKIKKYLNHKFKHPFDFLNYIKHVRTACQHRTIKTSFVHVEKYHKTSKLLDNNCLNVKCISESKFCLKRISFFNKQSKNVNFKISSVLGMYFPLCFFIYHKFIIELPDLAQKNTIEIIQIMNTYGYAPFFHNNPKYNFWNVLRSSFADPFRTMTRSILTSDIPEIKTWIRCSNFALEGTSNIIEKKKDSFVKDNLSVYENLPQIDSTK